MTSSQHPRSSEEQQSCFAMASPGIRSSVAHPLNRETTQMKQPRLPSKTIFLLGAGASVEAGIAVTSDITRQILEYDQLCPSQSSKQVEQVLHYIRVQVASQLAIRVSDVNFEHIVGCLADLVRMRNSPHPTLLGATDPVFDRLSTGLNLERVYENLFALLRHSMIPTKPFDYMLRLGSLLLMTHRRSVYTLNYDLCLEDALHRQGIPFTDGFRSAGNGPRTWNPVSFRMKDRVRIFKLHGSLNWALDSPFPPPRPKPPAAGSNANEWEQYLASYPRLVRFSPESQTIPRTPTAEAGMACMMNFGVNKDLIYSMPHFTTLWDHFLNDLEGSDLLVLAGYSFSDLRVNRFIFDSLFRRFGKLRLLVVNPASYALGRERPELEVLSRHGLVKLIPAGLGATLRDDSLVMEAVKLCGMQVREIAGWDSYVPAPAPGAPEPVLAAVNAVGTAAMLLSHYVDRVAEVFRSQRLRRTARKDGSLDSVVVNIALLLRRFLIEYRGLDLARFGTSDIKIEDLAGIAVKRSSGDVPASVENESGGSPPDSQNRAPKIKERPPCARVARRAG